MALKIATKPTMAERLMVAAVYAAYLDGHFLDEFPDAPLSKKDEAIVAGREYWLHHATDDEVLARIARRIKHPHNLRFFLGGSIRLFRAATQPGDIIVWVVFFWLVNCQKWSNFGREAVNKTATAQSNTPVYSKC
jgi:hypothetical protein